MTLSYDEISAKRTHFGRRVCPSFADTCRCPVASKTSSTEYEDEGHFDPKLRGRHGLNKNVDATHLATPLNAASTAVWRISNTPARQDRLQDYLHQRPRLGQGRWYLWGT
jgi:hypothetical protein